MSWRSRPDAWTLALILLAPAGPSRAAAQGWDETQAWGVALASTPAVIAGGLGVARRDRGRTRLGGAVAFGRSDDGRFAARAEAAWHFLLDPARRSGLSVYGGGGLAVTAIENDNVRPFVQVVVGVESGPASSPGVFLEAGFGGGARLAAGLRFRRRLAAR